MTSWKDSCGPSWHVTGDGKDGQELLTPVVVPLRSDDTIKFTGAFTAQRTKLS